MTELQTKWAARHDWFLRAELQARGSYAVYVLDAEGIAGAIRFVGFKQLRSWAGY